ncbi:MAG: SLC13 family permease, partial [Candidatus Competibacter sp.]|nr:SLC13 family permease [Candidatus Competibacter sp.]
MTEPMLIVFGVLAGAVVLFAWGRPRADIVAILVVLALMLSRVLTPQESLAGFGDPVVILIAAIFIVGEALVNTGIAHRLGEFVLKLGGGNETRSIVLVMGLAGGIGAFMSSSAIVALFVPVVLRIADKTGLNRKRMLMPLSVAALISGMMTLIASSPNMIVENTLRAHHLAPLGFFSWTPFGLAVLVAGIVFMLAARCLLGPQRTAEEGGAKPPSVYDLIGAYGLAGRWHRLRVLPGSPLLDRSVARVQLHRRSGVLIVGFEKHLHGKAHFLPALPETVFEPDDVILVIADRERAQALIAAQNLVELPPLDERQRHEALQDIGAVEIMLAPDSKLIGKTLRELEFRSRYQVTVLAVRRRGEPLVTDLADLALDFGDTLLIAGGWDDIQRLWEDRENFVVLTVPAEYHERLPARQRAPVAVGILVAMVAVMAFGLLPNSAAALLAALGMIATGCVKLDAIYRVISWKTVVLIAGMLPLATALTKTGATELMAHQLVAALGSLGPVAMLAVVFLVTALVGLFISNSATAVLIAPVAIEAAQTLHVSPQAFAMTVAIACCAAYVTPVSSPVNMLVMEPGGYSFGDYVKVGLPLLALTMLVTIA